MGKLLFQYQKKLNELEVLKEKILEDVVSTFKKTHTRPLTIGNMTYFYDRDSNGKYFPTYLDSVSGEFKPIYDKEETYDFGWADFDQVVRILDVINERLKK